MPKLPPSHSALINDPAREATDTLRGYSYQVLRSVLVWIELREDEILYLEGAEDLDRVSRDQAALEQVKDTQGSGNVTLRSQGVVEAIGNYWGHRKRNPGRRLGFRYLTTSGIGMERGDPLGEGVPGLELWERTKVEREAARRASYIAKIRKFLIELANLPAELKEELRSATDEEILANLIQPISWETGAGPHVALLEEVKKRLVLVGNAKGIAARDAENVVGALHLQAWTVATRDKDRALDRAGFIRLFDDQTQTSVSKADLAALISRSGEESQTAARLDDLAMQVGAIPPQVAEALEGRLRGIESALVARGQPQAIDRDLARRLAVAERRTGFPEGSQANPFSALGQEAVKAGSGSDALRRRVLLRATRAAAIRGDLVEAEAFFAAAQAVPGPADETPARARLLEARGQVDEAIRLLRDRQDPDSLSILMDIQRRAQGDGWVLEREELGMLLPDRLTPDGLINLAQTLRRAGQNERVEALLAGASEEQLDACSFLLLLRAFNQLALTLPAPDRHLIKDGVPLIVAQLRPAVAGDELRRRLDDGLRDLTRLTAHLVDLELPATRSQVREIARLFQLMHPERQAEALSELRALLDQPGQALDRLSFAFAFLPGFDPAPIGHYLATREELGGLDDAELRAAFVVAFHDDPRFFAEFIAKHRSRLERALRATEIASLEVQALAAAGDPASARLVFDRHVDEFESPLKSLLLTKIATAEGDDPVMAHKRLFEETRSLTSLRALVSILASHRDSAALAHYGQLLYEQTSSLEDALVAARAMAVAKMADAFSDFVERNSQIIERDPELKRYQAWQLLFAGRIKEAQRLAADLRDAGAERRDLDLEMAIAIDSGDWESLAVPLARFLERRGGQSGLALIRAAQIARVADLPVTMALVEAAVERAPQDATVLITAYTIATECGEDQERRPETNEWFRRALELSGPEGPVQRFTIKELLAKQQDWQSHVREVNDRLLRGELPLSLAAPALRTTITHIILRHLISNPVLPDPRGRVPIPLFAGHRLPTPIGEDRRIAVDITAVLVLARLGLLAKMVEAYPCPTIAAGIMRQLFEERQRIRYHQRSRVERARHIRDAIASPRGLKVVRPSFKPLDPLSSEIGVELADLFSAAEADNGVVLRPAPVHVYGPTGERDADMTTHQGRLADMHALLRVLVRLGRLDEQTEEVARRYFEVQDSGWANSAEPDPARPLFLDGLALEHLQTLDLLDVVLRAFSSVHIHTLVDEETTELLAYEEQGDEAMRVIDSARRTIHAAFEGDAIRFGPRRAGAEDDDDRGEFPILHILSDLTSVDVLLVDDRALAGQGVTRDADGRQVRIATTLDVIEDLRSRELITVADWRRHRFALRRCGAMLVPLDADEVVAGATRSGETESAELRAIRECLSLARLTELPHFPRDIRWFISICTGITHGIQRTFAELPRDHAEGVASYLYRVLPDPGDWLGFWHGGAGLDWVEGVDRVLHQDLVAALDIDDPLAREAYHAWVEERVLEPMRSLAPERYRALVQLLREFLLESRSDHVDGG